MKRLMKGLLVLAGAIGLYSSTSEAAITVVGNRNVLTSSVTVGGTISGGLTVQVKNRSNNAKATNIGWSGIQPGQTTWDVADQYVSLISSYNAANFAVRTYTDNLKKINVGSNSTISYSGPIDNNRPAPLLSRLGASTTTTNSIPMAWRIVSSTAIITASTTTVNAPDSGDFTWFFMKDAAQKDFDVSVSTSGFNNTNDPLFDYATVWNDRGLHVVPDAYDVGAAAVAGVETNNLYFALPQQSARVGGNYQTNRLIVELLQL